MQSSTKFMEYFLAHLSLQFADRKFHLRTFKSKVKQF